MGLTIDINTGLPIIDKSPHKQFSGAIPAGQTLVIDSVNMSEFSRLDYSLAFYNDAENITKSMKFIVNKRGTVTSDQVFGRIGALSISVDSVVSAGEYNLEITNSEAFAVNYCLTVLTS